MPPEARGRVEIDDRKLRDAISGLARAAAESERLQGRLARGASRQRKAAEKATGPRVLPGPQKFIGALAGIAGLDKLGEVARGLGAGQSIEAIIKQQIDSFVRGPMRTVLRPFILGLILDYIEAYDKQQQELLNLRFEREREQSNLVARLNEDPAFARQAAAIASREFEASAGRRRQLARAAAQGRE